MGMDSVGLPSLLRRVANGGRKRSKKPENAIRKLNPNFSDWDTLFTNSLNVNSGRLTENRPSPKLSNSLMTNSPTYIDLFAGAGGLSEGFIRAGFRGLAHVEADSDASTTLETRLCYWYLRSKGRLNTYKDYLLGQADRELMVKQVPKWYTRSVINEEICAKNLRSLYRQIDAIKGNCNVDLVVGGPPCQAYSLVGRSRDLSCFL